MEQMSLVTQAEQSAAEGNQAMAGLITLSTPDLFAALGHQAAENTRGAPGAGSFAVVVNLDDLDRGPEAELGRRIFMRWNKALHEFLCSTASEDADLKSRVLHAMSGKNVSASALLVGLLVGTFGLAPAVATIISALLVKLIIQPAGDEVCKFWGDQLGSG